jgi:tetratricopeptide (TPR) repeat protein
LRQIPAAELAFTRSLALEQENPSALSGLSFCRSMQRQYPEAAELALEGISLLFHHFYSHYCYGIALAHLGDKNQAIRAFENTLRFQPRFHRARHYLIHLLKGRPEAKPIADQHRSILLQRAIDDLKTQWRRRDLRDQLESARQERAATRSAERAARSRRAQPNASPPLDLIIISGLPRSGTSLLMQMIEAAGIPIKHDGFRPADEHNLQGYYEWERVKELPRDPHLIAEAAGRAVKVVSPLLQALPKNYRYRIVFVRRDLEQTVLSQDRMRQRLTGVPPEESAATRQRMEDHLRQTYRLLERAPNVEWIEIRFELLLERSPPELRRLADFLGIPPESIAAMQAVVK